MNLAFASTSGRRPRGEHKARLYAVVAAAILLTLVLPVFAAHAAPATGCQPNGGLAPENVFLNCLNVYARDRAALAVWETATEIDNRGFFVLRSNTSGGLFERVNSTIVFSTADPGGLTGAHYEYLDSGLVNGQTYYYKLEAVNLLNQSQFVPEEPVPVTLSSATATPTSTAVPPTPTPTPTSTAGPTLTPSNTPPPGASLTPTLTPSATATGAPPSASPTASPSAAGTTASTQIAPTAPPSATMTAVVASTAAGPTATPEPKTPANPPLETPGAPTSAPQPTDEKAPDGGPNVADLTPAMQSAATAIAAAPATSTPARTRVPPPTLTPTPGQTPVNWALFGVAAVGVGLLLVTAVTVARRRRGPGNA